MHIHALMPDPVRPLPELLHTAATFYAPGREAAGTNASMTRSRIGTMRSPLRVSSPVLFSGRPDLPEGPFREAHSMAQPHRAVPAAPPAYIGRFAPSPSGPLHAGSVVAALASYLDARAHDGLWLLRIEDIDPPRVEPGSDLTIRQQLRFLGLHWDGPPLYQSARVDRYQAVFDWLRAQGRIYGCGCTRREIIQAAHMLQTAHTLQTAQALQTTEALQTTQALQTTGARQAGPTRQTEPAHQASQRPSQALNTPADETPYPGTCRHGLPAGRQARAWRFRIDTTGTPPPQTLPEATNPLASADFVQPTDGNFPAAQERISNVGKAADLSNSGLPDASSLNRSSSDSVSANSGLSDTALSNIRMGYSCGNDFSRTGVITFHDRWLGPQRQNPSLQCGDFILKRADGVWAYQLGVVVDDAESGVTDVVRGADLLSSTGRQILLLQALGAPVPRYLHLPLVMGGNGQKLSKQNGAPGVDTSGRMDAVDILNEAARALGLRQPGTRDVQRWLHEATAQWRARFCGSTINRQ